MSDILVESDRVPMTLTRHAILKQGIFGNVSMTFSIPQENTFWGQRLELVPQVRSVPLDASAAGQVFSRASWTIEQGSLGSGYTAAIDVLWRIGSTVGGQSREYQNAPCSIPMLFGNSPFRWAQSAFPSALEFDQEWYLPGGSALTVTLTPTYMSSATAPDAFEYRILGILTGAKEVY